MPDAIDEDRKRWDRVRHGSILIANLWLQIAVAAERADRPSALTAQGQIEKLEKTAFALLKELQPGGGNG